MKVLEEQPLISIITATYNSAVCIGKTLSSMNSQTYPVIEHIISDGNSSDGTLQVVADSARRHHTIVDSRPDSGVYEALNLGIQRSRGSIIGVLHADDVFAAADSLSLIADAFREPEVMAVYTDLVFTSHGRIVRRWKSSPYKEGSVFWGWIPPHPTVFLRREVFEKTGPYLTEYRIAGDYEFLVRVFAALKPEQTRYLPVVSYCMETGGLSTQNGPKMAKLRVSEDLSILSRHFHLYFVPYVMKILRKVPQFISRQSD